jgi:nitroreductase
MLIIPNNCVLLTASFLFPEIRSSRKDTKSEIIFKKEGVMRLAEVAITRRSIRKYLKKDVPDELIIQAFELARWAPSGGNFQPWQFIVVKKREIIKRIADAVQAKVDILTGWPEAREVGETAERYRNNASYFREAPVLIAALSGEYKSVADSILFKRGEKDAVAVEMTKNRQSAPTRVQQIGGCIALILLALHSMGLGACWMSGPLIAKQEIEEILGVPGEWDLVALIPVGYPDETPAAKTRKTVDELVVFVK